MNRAGGLPANHELRMFVETVRKTGRKTLIIAGVWTSVCVAFPALQAKAEGYKVYRDHWGSWIESGRREFHHWIFIGS